jgi:hypothetical protein
MIGLNDAGSLELVGEAEGVAEGCCVVVVDGDGEGVAVGDGFFAAASSKTADAAMS